MTCEQELCPNWAGDGDCPCRTAWLQDEEPLPWVTPEGWRYSDSEVKDPNFRNYVRWEP